MQLRSGTRFGPYELIEPIGRGGMGEVFRARDARLGRDVAIKFLAPELAGDPTALARFERESRAVAALSHPNIVALFDVGHERDTAYAVTELLEGATLRDKLHGGALPPRKAIEYVRAVAEAIAAAHSRGIIHRDIKPDNLFVTSGGGIKVLDFGIAHVTAAPVGNATDDTKGPPATVPGTMIGTIGYMAPEQVRGGTADQRTDIFALGTVLYEALTGQAAFARDTPADTVSAILTAEPPALTRIGSSAGPGVEQIVRRCLEKEPDERFQSARDLSFALEAVAAGPGVSAARAEAEPSSSASWRIAAAIGMIAIATGGFLAGRWMLPPVPAPPTARFSVPANTAPFDAVSVSPDGRYVAYTGAAAPDNPAGNTGVSVRRLDAIEFTPLPETNAAIRPFVWSPDSRTFGYFVNTALVVRDIPNGPERVIAQLPGRATGASWGPNGVMLVSTAEGIYRLPVSGGTPEFVMRTDRASEIWRSWPSFLPGGDRFIYSALKNNGSQSALETRVASLAGQDLGVIATGLVGAMYAQGHLLFGEGGGLSAQPFDLNGLRLTGERRQITAAVSQNWRSGDLAAGASETGVLVFRPSPQSEVQFTWVDRAGRHVGMVGTPANYTNFDVSPDGRRIAATRRDAQTGVNSLVLVDVERGVTTPITPADAEDFDDPTWTLDGLQIAYRRGDSLVMRGANGGEERVLVNGEAYPDHFSRDGRFITFGRQRLGFYEAHALDVTKPGSEPIRLVSEVTLSDEARFSRNGRWVAYAANQSGSDQVWVIAFPPTGEKWQISQRGGVQPRWSSDGNELFFLDPDGRLMAVSMPDSDPRRAGEPRPLFTTGLTPSNALDQIAVVGDRFLLRLPPSSRIGDSSPIQILVNWIQR